MTSRPLCIGLGALAIYATTGAAMAQTIHELKPTPSTVVYGYYDARQKPVLTIDSGDIVRLWTATGNPRYFESIGVPREKIPPELFVAFAGAPDDGRGDHTMDGPIHVRGAEVGDTIEVKIRSIELWLPIAAMSTRANRGSLPEDFPYSRDRVMWLEHGRLMDIGDPERVVSKYLAAMVEKDSTYLSLKKPADRAPGISR